MWRKQRKASAIYRKSLPRYTESRKRGGAAMAGRRICAGYYRRYDSKVVYVVSLATDADACEEMVIWTTYPLCGCPQVLHLQQKILLCFCGDEWGAEGQVKAADEYENLRSRC